ncbi:MAG: hypothetical protein CVT47_01230 [Thermoplasmata archaeon HGW-Thermoplasmata-2]|nr:MAG: hypothetical protein CVT47_01230 [Thermoplasmata archaeon HGW-Thermoplasmata-2]
MKNSKRFPQRLAVVCVGLALAISLITLVPNASAAVTQKWCLLKDSAGVSGADYKMQKAENAGSSTNVFISDAGDYKIWVANEVATESVGLSGDWAVKIAYGSGAAPDIYIGVLDPDTGAFTPKGSRSSFPNNAEFTVTTTDHIIPNGDYLAIKIVNNEGSGQTIFTTLASGQSRAWIKSPSTDPGYPVPELSTLILMSSGLVAGTAILIYGNKKYGNKKRR